MLYSGPGAGCVRVQVHRAHQPRHPAGTRRHGGLYAGHPPPQVPIYYQGSGSGLDPDSIGSVDPDPDSESGSGSRGAKMTHKSRQKFVKVNVF